VARRKFDQHLKEHATELAREAGKPAAQVARDLGISDSTLRNWVWLDRRRWWARQLSSFSSPAYMLFQWRAFGPRFLGRVRSSVAFRSRWHHLGQRVLVKAGWADPGHLRSRWHTLSQHIPRGPTWACLGHLRSGWHTLSRRLPRKVQLPAGYWVRWRMSRRALRVAAVILLPLNAAVVAAWIVMETSIRPASLLYVLYIALSLVIGTIATTTLVWMLDAWRTPRPSRRAG
jgi:transposase